MPSIATTLQGPDDDNAFLKSNSDLHGTAPIRRPAYKEAPNSVQAWVALGPDDGLGLGMGTVRRSRAKWLRKVPQRLPSRLRSPAAPIGGTTAPTQIPGGRRKSSPLASFPRRERKCLHRSSARSRVESVLFEAL
jgi:hypothetical protein